MDILSDSDETELVVFTMTLVNKVGISSAAAAAAAAAADDDDDDDGGSGKNKDIYVAEEKSLTIFVIFVHNSFTCDV